MATTKQRVLNARRLNKFKQVAAQRQQGLTVILENVHDQHNIGAVLRSCDSVGITEIFVLFTEEGLGPKNVTLGKRTSAGAREWVDVHFYTDAAACFEHVRRRYDQVWCTHLGEASTDLYDLDLCGSVALLFGNERDGVSAAARKLCDGNFAVPQMGMTESLNISVACAVSLYEAYRQRKAKGFYGPDNPLPAEQRAKLLRDYIARHESRHQRRTAIRRGK